MELLEQPCPIDVTRLNVTGVSVVAAGSHDSPDFVLELLRGSRTSGRLFVWRHAAGAMSAYDAHEIGRTLADARPDMLAVSGISGREIAVGARDGGLEISKVIVCRGPSMTAGVLAERVAPGDVIVLVGIDNDGVEMLTRQIAARWGAALAVA